MKESIYNKGNGITKKLSYLNPVDIFKQVSHPYIIMSASRRSGKTFTLRDILNKCKHKFDDVILISNTSEFNVDYDYIPDDKKFKTDKMNSIIEDIKNKQKELLKKKKKMMEYLIIFDDILDDDSVSKRNSNVINDLATLGRHLNLSCVVLTQSFIKLSTIARANCDFCFMSRSRNERNIEQFCESYLTGEMEGSEDGSSQKKIAKQIYFGIVSNDFHWLCVHNTKQNSKGYSSFCFQYVADCKPTKKFNLLKNKGTNIKATDGDGKFNKMLRFKMGYTNEKASVKKLRTLMMKM